MFKLPKFNIYFLEIIFLLVVGLIPLFWYKDGSMALGHDMTYPLAPVDFFKDRLFTWSDRMGSFGSNQTDALPGSFIHGLEALVYLLTSNLIISQKIVFVFWFVLPGITMYILLRSLYPEKENFIVRISGSLFYMLNHYLLQGWIIAEMTKFSIVSAIPIVVLTIINVFYKKKPILKQAVILSLTLFFLNGGSGIPLWGGLALAAIIVLVSLFLLSPSPFFEKIKRTLSFIFLSLFFMILLNLYWIYPYIISFNQNYTNRVETSGNIQGAINWSNAISRDTSFTNLFRLQGIPDWYGNDEHPYAKNFLNNPLLIILTTLFPLIALFGLLKKDQSKDEYVYTAIFFALLLISIPFAVGSHPPTGFIYDLALKHIPGFVIFRTPFYKFGMLVWFAFAFLIAFGLRYISQTIKDYLLPKLSQKAVDLAVLGIFIILIFIYNYPAFTGSFFNWSQDYSTMVKVPDYIFEAKKELDNNKFSTRTLILPDLESQNKVDSYDWRYYSLSTVFSILSRRPVITNDVILRGEENNFVNYIYSQIKESGYPNLLDYFGADQMILRNDFTSKQSFVYSLEDAKSAIVKSDRFILEKNIGQWSYYKIKNSELLPLIYIPNSVAYIRLDPSDIRLLYNDFNPKVSEAFIYDDINKFNSTKVDSIDFSRYEITGKCTNCYSSTRELKFEAPRVMPGTSFYWLSTYFEKLKKNNIKDPSQKIDFILGIINKKIGVMNSLPSLNESASLLVSVIDEIDNLLKEVKSIYQDLPLESKNNKKDLIYDYLRYLEVDNAIRQQRTQNEVIETKLISFRKALHNYVVSLNVAPDQYPPPREDKSYLLEIPKPGRYEIKIFVFQRNIKNQDNIEVILDGKKLKLTKVDNNEGWFTAGDLLLDQGIHRAILPIDTFSGETDVTNLQDISILTSIIESRCQDLNLGKVDFNNTYKINFTDGNDRLLSSYITEAKDSDLLLNSKASNLETINKFREINGNTFTYYYVPRSTAKYAALRLCAKGFDPELTILKARNVQVVEIAANPSLIATSENTGQKLSTPKVDFTALNQTKYLVHLAPSSSDFTLVFNSRYDDQWKIREIDLSNPSIYFKGEEKNYLEGRVTEYARQDQHILTDWVFPKKEDNITTHFIVNGIFNGWKLAPKNSDRYYLLEYESQNVFYKTVIVSMISLLTLMTIWLFVRKRY